MDSWINCKKERKKNPYRSLKENVLECFCNLEIQKIFLEKN